MAKPKKPSRWRDYHHDPVLNETKCRRCGRTFIAAPQHIYKVGKALYCSWTCFNHRNDPKEETLKTNENH